jgi:hydrogenase-1 operon protein HyaF
MSSASPGKLQAYAIETPGQVPTGNVAPLLHEIRHALQQWLDKGQEHAIDLRGLPMTAAEEQKFMDVLGEGEVSARLSLEGLSTVIETRFPAVWIINHYDNDEKIVGRYIEICAIPAILKSQPEDAGDGLKRLAELLAADRSH